MRNSNITKIYGIIGMCLLTLAGAIIGFVKGETVYISIGVLVGFLLGYFFNKAIIKPASKNE